LDISPLPENNIQGGRAAKRAAEMMTGQASPWSRFLLDLTGHFYFASTKRLNKSTNLIQLIQAMKV
jgi:hypothetical protein